MYITRIETNNAFLRKYRTLNYQDIHRFIQSLFGEARKTSNVLYDMYEKSGTLVFIISSDKKPNTDNKYIERVETVDMTEMYGKLKKGLKLNFQIKTAPFIKKNVGEKNSVRVFLKDTASRTEWFKKKAEKHGFTVCAVNELGGEEHFVTKTDCTTSIPSYTYQGVLEITNLKEFKETVSEGMGCGRAYGNGLLLIR